MEGLLYFGGLAILVNSSVGLRAESYLSEGLLSRNNRAVWLVSVLRENESGSLSGKRKTRRFAGCTTPCNTAS